MTKASLKRQVLGQPWALMPSVLDAAVAKLETIEPAGFSLLDMEVTPLAPRTINSVAVVDIVGAIVKERSLLEALFEQTCTVDEIRNAFDEAMGSDASAVVLRIDSPGGVCAGAISLASHIFAARQSSTKPVIAFADGCMCSAAFELGAQCDAVVVSEDAVVGNLGVIAITFDLTQALVQQGIIPHVFRSAPGKGAGGEVHGHNEEQMRSIDGQVQKYFQMFRASVQRGRGLTDAELDALSDAHISIGPDAVRDKMADEVGTLDDLVERYG